MRGKAARQVEMITAVTPDALVPQSHPIRRIKPMVDRALAQLPSTFDTARAPAQSLLADGAVLGTQRAPVLRMVGKRPAVQVVPGFEHHGPQLRPLGICEEPKSIAGGGSISRVPAGGGGRNREVDFRGQRRRNEIRESTPEPTKSPEARLAKQGSGKEARLCFAGHVLMDNRQGLVMDVMLTPAGGTWERDGAITMLGAVPGTGRITVDADRGYDARGFIWRCRNLNVTPRVVQKQRSAIDERTTRHEGYRVSQRVRQRVEEVFGWIKTVAGGRKLRYRGVDRNRMWAELTVAGYNLVRLAKLTAVPA